MQTLISNLSKIKTIEEKNAQIRGLQQASFIQTIPGKKLGKNQSVNSSKKKHWLNVLKFINKPD